MRALICITAGLLFVVSTGAYIYVRIRLRPKYGSDLDDWYYEFEEQHPEYAKYLRWSKITFTAVIISMLLMFIALMI